MPFTMYIINRGCDKMDHKIIGWIQIIGGVLALAFSGSTGYSGMMGMMGYYGGYNMMSYGSGLAVSIIAIVLIIMGIHHITENKKGGKNETKSWKN